MVAGIRGYKAISSLGRERPDYLIKRSLPEGGIANLAENYRIS